MPGSAQSKRASPRLRASTEGFLLLRGYPPIRRLRKIARDGTMGLPGSQRPRRGAEGRTAMQLKFLWKDASSGAGGCPAIYATDGGYVVQGVRLDDATRAALRDLADNEDAVFVPANVL